MEDFWNFLAKHADGDPVCLVLSQHAWPDFPSALAGFSGQVSARDLAVNTLETRRRLRKKVPSWSVHPRLVFPVPISAEQCSSEATASYKARLAGSIRGIPRMTQSCLTALSSPLQQDGRMPHIADLTGGLGVDAWALGKVAVEVLYNEMNPLLVAAARHNFRELGCQNIRIRDLELKPGNLAELLDGFEPDVIFLDPARRASDGRKVFRLEDCTPDVLVLLPELFSVCRHILLKLSPMADISLIVKQFRTISQAIGLPGNPVREIHAVASAGECKELLVWLDREWGNPHTLVCVESGNRLTFTPSEESQAAVRLPADASAVNGWLFEPGKALSKAGQFDSLCSRFDLVKLGRHTHLYLAPEASGELKKIGTLFRIQASLPLNKRTLKEIGIQFPKADVTARNIPMNSEELAKRMKVTPGGGLHIFGVRIDSATQAGNYLLVCSRTD